MQDLSGKAEGRRQKAEGFCRRASGDRSACCVQREQGFKTPTKMKIWWLAIGSGSGSEAPTILLPSAFCPLPSSLKEQGEQGRLGKLGKKDTFMHDGEKFFFHRDCLLHKYLQHNCVSKTRPAMYFFLTPGLKSEGNQGKP